MPAMRNGALCSPPPPSAPGYRLIFMIFRVSRQNSRLPPAALSADWQPPPSLHTNTRNTPRARARAPGARSLEPRAGRADCPLSSVCLSLSSVCLSLSSACLSLSSVCLSLSSVCLSPASEPRAGRSRISGRAVGLQGPPSAQDETHPSRRRAGQGPTLIPHLAPLALHGPALIPPLALQAAAVQDRGRL